MKKVKLLKIINAIMAIDFFILAGTAIANIPLRMIGIYGKVHAIPGFIFLACAICHIILNRDWIKKQYFAKKAAPKNETT